MPPAYGDDGGLFASDAVGAGAGVGAGVGAGCALVVVAYVAPNTIRADMNAINGVFSILWTSIRGECAFESHVAAVIYCE